MFGRIGNMFLSLLPIIALLSNNCGASPITARALILENPGLFDNVTSSKSLVWQNCRSGYSCALLEVPLDYSKPSGAKAFVPLLKVSATATPYKGMVFVNPGGPGISAVDWLLGIGAQAPTVIGPNYDTVVYEPRGIGYSLPNADCGVSISPGKISRRTYNQVYGPRLSFKSYSDEFSYQQGLGSACAAAVGGSTQAGPHMSTQVVVRDAISILDAYGASAYSAGVQNPKNFNFWGLSYGTVIGQTFAQLYSNRVGRFVLDGVNDAADYYSGSGLKNIQLADRALSRFFDYCAAAGENACLFWSSTSTAIFNRFEALVLRLDAKKAYQENWSNKTEIYGALEIIKFLGVASLSNPLPLAPLFAAVLAQLEASGNNINLASLPEGLYPLPKINPQWLPAVLCPDTGNKFLGKSLQQIQSQLNQIEEQSWIAGEIFAATGISCTSWSIKPKTRYTGGFGATTKTPILFVSNTLDPRTPIMNGVKALTLYKDSRLLTIDALGHTSYYAQNMCGFAAIQEYFRTGIASTYFCRQEAGPFGVTLATPIVARAQDDVEKRLTSLPRHVI